jgi:hypothetical protein
MNVMTKTEKIRTILLRDWDPFCVGDNANLTDEYDGFIGNIHLLLEKNCSEEELSSHLLAIENHLASPIADSQRAIAVKALKNI